MRAARTRSELRLRARAGGVPRRGGRVPRRLARSRRLLPAGAQVAGSRASVPRHGRARLALARLAEVGRRRRAAARLRVHPVGRGGLRARGAQSARLRHRREDDRALGYAASSSGAGCRRSARARSTSRSATPSPKPARISRACAAARSGAATRYVVTGQKCWQSYAQDMDYLWLLCRTGSQESRGKGLSLLIVDLRAPGVRVGRAADPRRRPAERGEPRRCRRAGWTSASAPRTAPGRS